MQAITRDRSGVVHIEAKDLQGACRGMGYVHAMDRGMQMLLMRILGRGRVSECLDSSDRSLAIDRFFRKMNWQSGTAEEIAKLSPGILALCEAYCEGVNSRLRESVPWEFKLLGYRPEPWTPEDTVLISRAVGYLTLAQSQAEVEHLLIEMVQGGVAREKLEALFPGLLTELDLELVRKVKLAERIVPDALKWGSPVPRMMASNNWVISGKLTASGMPILANDPHLESNRLPNVWYEMAVKADGRWAIGVSTPGLPGVLIGRNPDVAWGATYTFMDAVDSWVERVRDGKYLREVEGRVEWVPFRKRVEVIKRKKKEPVEVVFWENEHGTLDGEAVQEGYGLATRWSASQLGARSITAMLDMWSMDSVESGRELVGRIESAFNWVLVDRKGNIGYQMSGLMPRRRPGATGFVPLPGWKPENDWLGFVPHEELPRVLNPEEGYFATANEDLNRYGRAKPINMPMGSYRGDRIRSVLASKKAIRPEDCMELHYDVYSAQAERFMAILKPLLPDTDQGRILRDWDFSYSIGSRAAGLFEAFYRELLVEVFGRNGLGNDVAGFLARETGTFIDFYDNFDRVLLGDESSPWFGGAKRADIFQGVANRTLATPPRAWGDLNRITLTNILFAGKLPRCLGFDRGPVPIPGGRATVHQGQIYRSADRATSFIASFRMVVEIEKDEIRTNLAGGPSDRRFSKWYCSDLKNWREGRYKTIRV